MSQDSNIGGPSAYVGDTHPKHPGLVQLDLHRAAPWCDGLVGLVKWLVWHTENVTGKSKNATYKQVITESLKQLELDESEQARLLKAFDAIVKGEVKDTTPENKYDSYRTEKFIHPFEATRRIRYFSEDFLNKEFDIFCALLPNDLLHRYLATHFELDAGGRWQIFGNSNDLEFTTNILFMQVDTLAYNPKTSTLTALELKIDAEVGLQQVLKYCFMQAALEDRGLIHKDNTLKLLIIGATKPTSDEAAKYIETAKAQLADQKYPKKGLRKDEAASLHERTEEILSSLELVFTTWQDLGGWFEQELPDLEGPGPEESSYKLIDGFLRSLEQKYSRKQDAALYYPEADEGNIPGMLPTGELSSPNDLFNSKEFQPQKEQDKAPTSQHTADSSKEEKYPETAPQNRPTAAPGTQSVIHILTLIFGILFMLYILTKLWMAPT